MYVGIYASVFLSKICYLKDGLIDCLVFVYYGYFLIRKGRIDNVLKF